MKVFEEKRKLAKEAIELIKEFNEVQECIKEQSTSNFKVVEDESKGIILITYDDDYNGEYEYFLSEIHETVKDEMEGFGPCGSGFYEAVNEEKQSAESTYGEVSKEEFIQNIGNAYYIEKRCEEIYDRLKKISKLCK